MLWRSLYPPYLLKGRQIHVYAFPPPKNTFATTGKIQFPRKIRHATTGKMQLPREIRHATTGEVQFPRKLRHATTGEVQFPRKMRVFGGSADSFRDPGGPRTPPEGLGGPLCSDSVSKQCLGGHYVAILCQNKAREAWGGCYVAILCPSSAWEAIM